MNKPIFVFSSPDWMESFIRRENQRYISEDDFYTDHDPLPSCRPPDMLMGHEERAKRFRARWERKRRAQADCDLRG